MQTPTENQINSEALMSDEYQAVESAIAELLKVLVLIQDGVEVEISQAQTIQKILKSQSKLMAELKQTAVVDIDQTKKLKHEYEVCLMALQHKAETIRTLNKYLGDKIRQMQTLQRKKEEIINKLTPAQVINFKEHEKK